MRLQESGEMYLESIYVLSKTNNVIHAIDICEFMGYSKPSISRAMGLLKNGGYIAIGGDGAISLTEEGLQIAKEIYERHQVLSKMLIQLGVQETVAKEDACRIEHVISPETFACIKAHFHHQSEKKEK